MASVGVALVTEIGLNFLCGLGSLVGMAFSDGSDGRGAVVVNARVRRREGDERAAKQRRDRVEASIVDVSSLLSEVRMAT